MGAYFLFQGRRLAELKKTRPHVARQELMKEVSECWKKMDTQAREPFVRDNQAAVISHQRQLQAYEAAGRGEATA